LETTSLEEEIKMEDHLASIYYEASNPASYGTVEKLWNAAQRRYPFKDVDRWLRAQDVYTLHKSRRSRFKRSRYFVPSMGNLYQCDLCDMRNLRTYNQGNKFILTVIDAFSKKAWAFPMKKKRAVDIIEGFSKIFETAPKPVFIQSDKGREFTANSVQEYFRQMGIKHYTTQNPDTKAAIIERFHRTLKAKMYKYFSFESTLNYIDILPKLLESYNNTVHSATNKAPNDITRENERDVYLYLYSGSGRYKAIPRHDKKRLLAVGDKVRISKSKDTFEQGYKSNWSVEIFTVSKILDTFPTRYRIKDWNGELIEGSFYAPELQRVEVSPEKFYKVDKILARRGKGSSREVFVSWSGYPSSFNSWIPAKQLS
jgi:hypothetical protein